MKKKTTPAARTRPAKVLGPAPKYAWNGMRLGVARNNLVGGPLEIFKIGAEAKTHLMESVQSSTVTHGRHRLETKVKLDPKTMTVKQRNRARKREWERQAVAQRRQKVKEAKRQRKAQRKAVRRSGPRPKGDAAAGNKRGGAST